jgi:hypothetical protein
MSLPSFSNKPIGNFIQKPQILVLAVRPRGNPTADPITWLLVERDEKTYMDDTDPFYRASIKLSYQQLLPRHSRHSYTGGSFEGGYSKISGRVSLTSSSVSIGSVILHQQELQGNRIGSYLMNEIVTWAKQWPTATVDRISLSDVDATVENKDRRNKFYAQFNIKFDYNGDPEMKTGRSIEMPASELTPVNTWAENITEFEVPDYIADILQTQEQSTLKQKNQERQVKHLLEQKKSAESKPIQWALRQILGNHIGIVVFFALVTLFAAAVVVLMRT